MTFNIIGGSSGIGQAAQKLLLERGHQYTPSRADALVFCAGHDYQICVEKLIKEVENNSAKSYIVVTSQHGKRPVGLAYMRYAAMKAAQKMVCKTIAKSGIPCVDISPAFVVDSGKNKRIHKDPAYWDSVKAEMSGDPPVTSEDVAQAIAYACENASKITGTEINVSAGWRL